MKSTNSDEISDNNRRISKNQTRERSMSLPAALHFNQEIAHYSKQKQYDQAQLSFERMLQNKVRPDVVTYNTMINVYVKSQRLSDAFSLFNQMKNENIEPTIVTYTSLIDGCGKCNNFRRAMVLYQSVKPLGISLNMHFFNAILNATFLKGNLQTVDMILSDIKESGLRPNTVTYNTMLAGYIRFNLLSRMKPTIEEMITAKVDFSPITQTTILQAAQLIKDQQTLMQFMDLLATAKFIPTKVQSSQAISDLVNARRLVLAQQFLGYFTRFGCQLGEEAFIDILQLAGELANFQAIQWTLEAARSYGYNLIYHGFIAQLCAFSKFNNYEKAVQMYDQLCVNYSPIPVSVNISMIQCFLTHDDMERSEKIIQELLKTRSLSEDESDRLLQMYFEKSLFDEVLKFSDLIREYGMKLAQKGFDYTIQSALKINQLPILLNSISELTPSIETLIEMISHCPDDSLFKFPWSNIIGNINMLPTPMSLCSLMTSLEVRGLAAQAWQTFRHFSALGADINENVANCAMRILKTSTSQEGAMFLLNNVKENGISVSSELFSTAIMASLANGDLATCINLKLEMDSLHLKLDEATQKLFDEYYELIKHVLPSEPPVIIQKSQHRQRSKTFSTYTDEMQELSKRSAMIALDLDSM